MIFKLMSFHYYLYSNWIRVLYVVQRSVDILSGGFRLGKGQRLASFVTGPNFRGDIRIAPPSWQPAHESDVCTATINVEFLTEILHFASASGGRTDSAPFEHLYNHR